jgi:hypothetical protein
MSVWSRIATALLLLSSVWLGGCVTSSANSSLMDARAEVPAPGGYMPVQEMPPKRENPALTPDEVLKLRKDLIDARDRQSPSSKAKADSTGTKLNKPQ